ncbi:hypothetical protein [Schleiferilactobacillus harbinensis]|jgi:hypothetical protein|uniref:hypothetical protein n=1 Tax=Schleiferilactobacillus harbinensis TaxID=304207 RepID=UPI00242C6657|nr:hypothetical protein [Schleiferilactobacillus harbinensis]MCI1850061.1 hypothetical protein [Schleiferilactobacillus harbinensis]
MDEENKVVRFSLNNLVIIIGTLMTLLRFANVITTPWRAINTYWLVTVAFYTAFYLTGLIFVAVAEHKGR